MKITFEAYKTMNMVGREVPGINLSVKTPKFKRSLTLSKDEHDFGGSVEVTTPTGKRVSYRKLLFGWKLETSRGPRVSHLVGIPPNLTMDDVVSFFGEEFPTLVRGALNYSLKYGWTKAENPDEYQSIISVLEGKQRQKVELTEEETQHQNELFEKLLHSGSLFVKSCECEMCQDINQREQEASHLNKRVWDETMERIYRIIPELGD